MSFPSAPTAGRRRLAVAAGPSDAAARLLTLPPPPLLLQTAAMPLVRSGTSRGTAAIVTWSGDWKCGCGTSNKLWDTCPSCGQASPCRWVQPAAGTC